MIPPITPEKMAASSAHTSGPWSLHPCHSGEPIEVPALAHAAGFTAWTFTVGCGDTIVAEVKAYSDGDNLPHRRPSTRAEAQAIAQLIAATTDMRDALLEVEAHHVKQNLMRGRPEENSKTLRIVRAALAKATMKEARS